MWHIQCAEKLLLFLSRQHRCFVQQAACCCPFTRKADAHRMTQHVRNRMRTKMFVLVLPTLVFVFVFVFSFLFAFSVVNPCIFIFIWCHPPLYLYLYLYLMLPTLVLAACMFSWYTGCFVRSSNILNKFIPWHDFRFA